MHESFGQEPQPDDLVTIGLTMGDNTRMNLRFQKDRLNALDPDARDGVTRSLAVLFTGGELTEQDTNNLEALGATMTTMDANGNVEQQATLLDGGLTAHEDYTQGPQLN